MRRTGHWFLVLCCGVILTVEAPLVVSSLAADFEGAYPVWEAAGLEPLPGEAGSLLDGPWHSAQDGLGQQAGPQESLPQSKGPLPAADSEAVLGATQESDPRPEPAALPEPIEDLGPLLGR